MNAEHFIEICMVSFTLNQGRKPCLSSIWCEPILKCVCVPGKMFVGYAYMWTCVYGGQKSVLWALPQMPSIHLLLFEPGTLTGIWGLLIRLGFLLYKPHDFCCPSLPSDCDYQHLPSCPYVTSCWGWNTDPHANAAGSLQAELPFQPWPDPSDFLLLC